MMKWIKLKFKQSNQWLKETSIIKKIIKITSHKITILINTVMSKYQSNEKRAWAGGRTCWAGGSTYCISGDDGDNVAQRNLQLDNYRAAHRSRRDVFNNWLGIEVTSGCHLAPAPLRLGGARELRARTPLSSRCPHRSSAASTPHPCSWVMSLPALLSWEGRERESTDKNKGYVYFARLKIKRRLCSGLITHIMYFNSFVNIKKDINQGIVTP